MLDLLLYSLAGTLLTTGAVTFSFLIYALIRYTPIIARVFEEKPLLIPLRLTPEPDGENVRFQTDDRLDLAGTYYKAKTGTRAGVIVFCHEFLSDRWSFLPYAGPFRDLGFDVFTFDFRNHGESTHALKYSPLQWVTDHEVEDVSAALRYLQSRPDHDAAGFGLFGVSRGGSAALVAGSKHPEVWGVVTDGAFPTRGTMLAYILRWAEIYVANPVLWKMMPRSVFRFLGWSGRMRSARRLNCRFPDVEHAVTRLAPRSWLMIHGEKDAYIVPAIARALFAEAKEPKEAWFVPKAKHNRCLQIDPKSYTDRVAGFLHRYAPQKHAVVNSAPTREPAVVQTETTQSKLKAELAGSGILLANLAAPVSG